MEEKCRAQTALHHHRLSLSMMEVFQRVAQLAGRFCYQQRGFIFNFLESNSRKAFVILLGLCGCF